MGVSFLSPLFLLGALAAAIPIVLHFLRRDIAPDVPFSAVRLLQRSPIERSKRRRLQDLLLLAARVLALLLLAAAFARPFVPGAAASAPGLRIIAVDRSFSMGAPGRFASALALAQRAVDEGVVGERVAVVAFDERADVVGAPGAPSDARAALGALTSGFGATRFEPVFAKAIELADGAAGTLVVVTDLQRSGWEAGARPVLPAEWTLDVRDAGAPPPNLAIVSVRLEAAGLVAGIRNTGVEARTGQVRVERDGKTIASAAYRVAPDSTVEVPIAVRSAGSGAVAVAIDDPRGYPADNTRYLTLEPTPAAPVLIITAAGVPQSGFYVSQALGTALENAGAAPALDVRVVTGVEVSAQDWARMSAVVLLSTRGLDRRARDSVSAFVRGGGGLIVTAAPDVEPAVLAAMFDWGAALADVDQPPRAVTLSATDQRHPIFVPFRALAANLGQVRVDRAWRVRPEGWDVAARFTDGTPAVLDRLDGKGRVVLFASDVDRRWNDFPLHPAFVPFAIEAVRYVSAARDAARDYPVGRPPAGAEPRPGVYRTQPDNRMVTVNVDPGESGTVRVRPDEIDGLVDHAAGTTRAAVELRTIQVEARQSYWQYGLALMLLTLVAESLVGRARG